jgi:hypothetical protein
MRRRLTRPAPPARTTVAVALLAVAVAAATAGWFLSRPVRHGSPSAGPAGPQSSGRPPPGVASVPGSSGSPSASVSASVSPAGSGPAAPGGWWRPSAGLTWQWQLSGALDRSVDARVYDVDAVEAGAADVAALHAAGRRVVCYVNVGAYERERPDAGRFPAAVLGKELAGWPGERWLDVRRWDVLEPILGARFDVCRAKGFDGVEPDNVDGYANESGFALSAADQLAFNRRIADLAHARGLAVGLKNDVEQAAALEPAFDFAVNESCAQFGECGALDRFVAAGKPVFHVEYTGSCPPARPGFSSMRKKRELDAWRQPC